MGKSSLADELGLDFGYDTEDLAKQFDFGFSGTKKASKKKAPAEDEDEESEEE